jgi:hypothetical protein
MEKASQDAVLGMGVVTVDQVAAHVAAAVIGTFVAIHLSND